MSRIVFLALLLCIATSHVRCKICRSMRILNNVTYLNQLRGCDQIWGSLEILLMHHTENESEFDHYVFPELKQITGYLMFYAIAKMTSIGKMFPDLRAIRGRELMADYALVLFNMDDLTEIGTTNLLFIGRGYVKVDRCPLLCYVNTVNWEKLGDNVKLHYNAMIETERDVKESDNYACEPCPAVCGGYCWNAMHCQDLEADKCHEECLGCSKEQSPRDCDVCKNYEFNGECVPECPPGTYNHTISNKCVTEEQCRTNMDRILRGDWWPYGRECVNDCPGDYQKQRDKDNKLQCVYCGSNCTKLCNTDRDVNTMDKLQKLKGCTYINGSLALRLVDIDPNRIIGDLSGYLGSIRHIRDSLIIGRSEGFTTLSVLKNLRLIEGKKLENKYALLVYDNPNLRELWNFSDPNFKLEIKNGTFAFNANPVLCVSEIIKLANITGMNYSTVDVSMYSNGDKAACNITDIPVHVEVTAREANITWEKKPCDGACIGYTIFYRRVELEDTYTDFDSTEVCIENEWNSTFTSDTSIVLKQLRPFTKHAIYLKVYHERSLQGSQSGMIYFVTKPDSPENPENLRAHAISSEIITLRWRRPALMDGEHSRYLVAMDMEVDETDLINLRDYCENPWSSDGTSIDLDSKLFHTDSVDIKLSNIASQGTSDPTRNNVCLCKTKKPPVIEFFKELSFFNRDITLNDCDIHSLSKFGFDECRDYKYTLLNISAPVKVRYNVEKRSKNTSLDRTTHITSNVTAYNFTDLQPFTMYIFYFSACNEINDSLSCSGVLQTFERTAKQEDADDIDRVDLSIQDTNVHITWTEPKKPNSMILAYKIIYYKTSTENSVPITICIPRDYRFNGSSWMLNYLLPGTYSIRVQAVSLAGPGRESQEITFVIEEPRKLSTTVVLWIFVTVIGIFVMILIATYWWKRTHPPITFRDVNPEYQGLEYEPDDWEIDREDIEMDANLGRGTFGTVYFGKIKSKNIAVAIKTANENMSVKDRMEFLNEASVMKAFSNCHHVIRLIGVVSRTEPPLVVMELMERGDLKKYLHRTRESSHNLTSNEIYRMAVEIADGMAYLAAKKFVHRDLAARNCMVAGDRTVKIGDFGMARDVYETDYYKKGTKGLLPVRWMAPESLADGVFTSDSDAWSYGIVLWEISTLAEQPYQGMSNEQVLQFVVSKGRLERPQECSDLIYEVMKQCWSWRPIDRPTFLDIVEKLEDHVGDNFKVVSFIHSREGNEHRIIHGRTRVYNAPAISQERDEDLIGRYNVSDDEVSLHVGTAPHRPSFLQSSLSQSRDSRFSPSDFY